MIWYPEFVGGAEASQKGLGDLIPAKLIDKSIIFLDLRFSIFDFIIIERG